MTATRLDDPARLAALEESGLLDKDVVGRLNHLTFSAVQITGADASQINVLGAVIQHTVAQYPEPLAEAMPVESSGCYEVVRRTATIAITDTVEHPQTCDLPWVQLFRGYLGTPVCFDGQPVGAMCVLSVEPRVWRTHDLLALEGLAQLAALSIDL